MIAKMNILYDFQINDSYNDNQDKESSFKIQKATKYFNLEDIQYEYFFSLQ